MSYISLNYEGCLADSAGGKGLDTGQMDVLAETLSPVIKKVNRARNDGLTPCRDLPYNQLRYDRTVSLAQKIRQECDYVIFIGSGNWTTGINMLTESMYSSKCFTGNGLNVKTPRVSVLDGYFPDQISMVQKRLGKEIERTFFVIAADSRKNAYNEANLRAGFELLPKAPRLLAISDSDSSVLASQAARAGTETLFVPAGIEGQLPLLSEAGLLYAAVCGIDIEQMLSGARAIDYLVSREEFYKNPAAINAAINWYYEDNGMRVFQAFADKEHFGSLSAWYSLTCCDVLTCLPGIDAGELKTYISPKKDKSEAAKNAIHINFDKIDAYSLGEFIYFTEVTALIFARLAKGGDENEEEQYKKWLSG
jgi:glucose-6-phosphate isomerase